MQLSDYSSRDQGHDYCQSSFPNLYHPMTPFRPQDWRTIFLLTLICLVSACGDGDSRSAADPAPTDPAPTDPAPTGPAPTDPPPTDPVTPPVPSVWLYTPSTVELGGQIRLDWIAVNVTSCSATDNWTDMTSTRGFVAIPASPIGVHDYSITCTGPYGSASSSVSSTVIQPINLVLTTDQSTVLAGESVLLQWTTDNAASCEAFIDWSGARPANGSEVVVIKNGGSLFEMSCTTGSVTHYETLHVLGMPAYVSLSTTSATAPRGATTRISWASSYATNCTASGDWDGELPLSGYVDVTVTRIGNNNYSLTCKNNGSTYTQTVTVTGTPFAAQLSIFPRTAHPGDEIALRWTTNTPSTCTASGGWTGSKGDAGLTTVTAGQTGPHTFHLTCTTPYDTVEQHADLSVIDPPGLAQATAYQITQGHTGSVSFPGGITFPDAPTWSVNLPGQVSYPVIADNRVFVTVRNSVTEPLGTQLHALNADTGTNAWQPISLGTSGYWSTLSYENGMLFALTDLGILSAFNATDGTLLWSRNLRGSKIYPFLNPPTAYGGMVFIAGQGDTGFLFALDATTGATIWSNWNGNGQRSAPSLTAAGLYLTYPCETRAIFPGNGELLWRKASQPSCSGGGGTTSPISNGILYAHDFGPYSYNTISFIDVLTREIIGSTQASFTAAVTDTDIFTRYNQTLRDISLSDGSEKWSFTSQDILASDPIVINGHVIIASSVGTVYAVDITTGNVTWTGNAGAGFIANGRTSSLFTGLAAGEGLLVAPVGTRLTAWNLLP